MKVIIAGSRHLMPTLDEIQAIVNASGFDVTEVVCGCASGIDTCGRAWAIFHSIPVKNFPADWKRHGKSAGPIRNRQMAEYADGAIVIWDGQSKGSRNMIEEMRRAGKPVYEVVV